MTDAGAADAAVRRAAASTSTTVKSSAESLLAIINDILDFSKIEARRLDLEHAEFDLRETVGDAAKLLALRAAEKGLELACHIAPTCRRRCSATPVGSGRCC